jgi:hypothetical protein
MKRLALIFILLVATSSLAQSSDESKSSGRVKSDKPTVYLEYICQDKKSVYFRMYNNTIWHILVTTGELYPPKTQIKLQNGVNTYAAPNDRAISLHYRVENWALPGENVKIPQIAYPHGGFSNWIASQDSILFSVPIEYLRKDLQVYVRFNYEWETNKRGNTINDPEHRVYFRGIDLPDKKFCK